MCAPFLTKSIFCPTMVSNVESMVSEGYKFTHQLTVQCTYWYKVFFPATESDSIKIDFNVKLRIKSIGGGNINWARDPYWLCDILGIGIYLKQLCKATHKSLMVFTV